MRLESTVAILAQGNISANAQTLCQKKSRAGHAAPPAEQCETCEAGFPESCANTSGAAGGTVALHAPLVNGTGTVSAIGGSGDDRCTSAGSGGGGAGGGGGRIR